jgi:hypothetical protein
MIPENVREFRKSLWTAACKAQGTDPTSLFVVFDETNEAWQAYNNFSLALSRAISTANKSQSSTIVYQSKINPLEFGNAWTLPIHGTRIGDRITPADIWFDNDCQ